MAVTEQTPRNISTAAAGATVFPYDFKILDKADLLVQIDGVVKVVDVDFTITGVGLDGGGSFTLFSPLVGGETVMRKRNMRLERLNDWQSLGDLRSQTLNNDQDAPVMMLQQVAEEVGRSLRLGQSVAGVSTEIGNPVPLAPLVWSADGTQLVAGSPLGTGDMLLRGDLVSPAAGKGAELVGFKQIGANVAVRTMSERARDTLTVLDFIGYNLSVADATALRSRITSRTATVADKANIALGVQAAFAAANARAGVRVYFPSGTYYLDGINVTGMHGLAVFGDGPEATRLLTDSATADVFYSTSETRYQTFAEFSVSSTVTRTAGAFFNLSIWRRGLIHHVRMTRWFNAVQLPTFEHCTVSECYITDPSGYGDAIIAGGVGGAGQGANLTILNCFVRGNDDVTSPSPVGRYGIAAYDVDAVYGINSDIGAFIGSDMLVAPSTRAANFHFLQCYFDATKDGDCLTLHGNGVKQQITFNGCWFASAGKLVGGSLGACCIRAFNVGSYQDVLFVGCRVFGGIGSGVLIESTGADIHFVGGTIYANGTGAGSNRHGFKWNPPVAATVGPSICGTRFGSNLPKDVHIGGFANGKHTIQDVHLDSGIQSDAVAARISGSDPTSNTYASAGSMSISPFHDFVTVTGTTNIGGIAATFRGHRLTLKFDAALVVVDNSMNIRLAGNFSTAAGSTLSLICDGAEWHEIARSVN